MCAENASTSATRRPAEFVVYPRFCSAFGRTFYDCADCVKPRLIEVFVCVESASCVEYGAAHSRINERIELLDESLRIKVIIPEPERSWTVFDRRRCEFRL